MDISGLSCLKIEAYKANGRVEPPLLPIEIEGELEYEVERILDKRINKLGCRRDSVEYLVKWLGYGHEHNSWKSAKAVANAQQLVQAFENRPLSVVNPQPAYICSMNKCRH